MVKCVKNVPNVASFVSKFNHVFLKKLHYSAVFGKNFYTVFSHFNPVYTKTPEFFRASHQPLFRSPLDPQLIFNMSSA